MHNKYIEQVVQSAHAFCVTLWADKLLNKYHI